MLKVKSDFHVPTDFSGYIAGILPDKVVALMAVKYRLSDSGLTGIDPACGAYTIPRVLRTMGAGAVDACDIDGKVAAVAQKQADELELKGLGTGEVYNVDFMRFKPKRNYDYIYTSLPFAWFMTESTDSIYAQSLKHMLVPKGMLIIDSATHAVRDGQKIAFANRQLQYFTQHGFKLVDKNEFITQKLEGFDSQFTELVFAKM